MRACTTVAVTSSCARLGDGRLCAERLGDGRWGVNADSAVGADDNDVFATEDDVVDGDAAGMGEAAARGITLMLDSACALKNQ